MFIVTGASSGIGRATAAALAERDADVLAVARSAQPLADLQSEHGSKLHALAADLSTPDGIAALVNDATSAERIDGIVHAAGSLIPPGNLSDVQVDELTDHFRIHVAVPIEINNQLADRLAGGRVAYIDSHSATSIRLGWCGYSIIKSAAQMAARATGEELQGVHVVRIFPGGVRTPLVQAMLDSPKPSSTKTIFEDLESSGLLAEPDVIGNWIATIMLDATHSHLASREFWDYGDKTAHL